MSYPNNAVSCFFAKIAKFLAICFQFIFSFASFHLKICNLNKYEVLKIYFAFQDVSSVFKVTGLQNGSNKVSITAVHSPQSEVSLTNFILLKIYVWIYYLFLLLQQTGLDIFLNEFLMCFDISFSRTV